MVHIFNIILYNLTILLLFCMSHIHTLKYMQMKHLIIGKYINKKCVNVNCYFDITTKCNTPKCNTAKCNIVNIML